MAVKVTAEIIEQINELYVELGVKAQVARKVGVSPATVTKYIIPNYIPKANRTTTHCEVEPSYDFSDFMREIGTMGSICALSEKEREELIELQKEIMI